MPCKQRGVSVTRGDSRTDNGKIQSIAGFLAAIAPFQPFG
jgi:hypothetical protein